VISGGPAPFLLGLVHGHFDVPTSKVDTEPTSLSVECVNTGIAIVVPVKTIQATIRSFEEQQSGA